MGAGAALTLGTSASGTVVNFPTAFISANITLNSTSTVTYQCNAAQVISSTPAYGNLTISTGASTVTKTLSASPLVVTGNLVLSNGVGAVTLSATTSTINLTGSLTGSGALSFTTGTLSIGEDFNLTGTFTCGTGLVSFNGSLTQSIGGTSTVTFFNMNVGGSAHTVQLTNTVSLINQINVLNNATFTTNGQTFTLLSTSTLNGNTFTGGGTAQVGDLSAGTFTGNVNYQRHINGYTDWRSLGWPISGTKTIADWTSQIATSGFTGSTDPSNSFVSIYTYNSVTKAYVPASNTSNPISADALSGGGLMVYVGNTSPGKVMSPEITLLSTGPIISGTQSPPITSSGTGTYNFMANPYPAPLLFSGFFSTNSTKITNFYYVYDETQGAFDTWDGALGSSSGGRTSGTIANGQAFFIQATSGSSLTFNENHKANSADGNFLKMSAGMFKKMRMTISGTASPFVSSMLVAFSPGTSNNYNVNEDALALAPFEPSAPTVTSYSFDGKNLVVNKMSDLTQKFDILVRATVGVSGVYTLTAPDLSDISGSCIILEDKLTGTLTDLNSTNSYTFSINDTTNTARFVLHFSVPITITTLALNPSCSKANDGMLIATPPGGTGPWTYSWKDSSGKVLRAITENTADTLEMLSAGQYLVDISTPTGCADQFEQSFTLIDPLPAIAAFTTSLTTIPVGDTIVFINTSVNASSYSWSYGDGYSSNQVTGTHSYALPGIDTVRLVAANGTCSADTTQLIIRVSPPTGIHNLNGNAAVSIVTLDNTGVLVHLNFSEMNGGGIEMYTLLGQLLSQQNFTAGQNLIRLNFPDKLTPGIYLVKVTTASDYFVRKVYLK